MPTPKTIDAAAFERAFQEALPGYEKTMREKANDAHAKGLIGANALMSAASVQTTFCTAWPQVKGFIKLAIKVLGFWNGGAATLAGAFITAVETQLVPIVCPVPPAE